MIILFTAIFTEDIAYDLLNSNNRPNSMIQEINPKRNISSTAIISSIISRITYLFTAQ